LLRLQGLISRWTPSSPRAHVQSALSALPEPVEGGARVDELMAILAQRLELVEQIGLAAAEGDAELAGELAAESNVLQEQQAEIALALGLELCFQPDAELPDPPAP
jgi:hypothetical protein